ncbi:MAG TPA: M20 family peptidase, partial [Variovorax sp.]
MHPALRILAAVACLLGAACAVAQPGPDERIAALAAQEKPAFLDTLKALVSIESGSRDLDGLAKITDVIAERFRALGGEVELID